MSNKNIMKVRDLKTHFHTKEGDVKAVDGISFDLGQNEVLSIVGESGSGKSVTGRSIVNLIESPGVITGGKIWYYSPELVNKVDRQNTIDGEYVNLLSISSDQWRNLRATDFGIVFQDPGSAFNPNLTVGRQIAEAVECNQRSENNSSYTNKDFVKNIVTPGSSFVSEHSRHRAVELLDRVNIPDPSERLNEYPHQFSGGMLQRAMVAQALASNPNVLIADEPTTGLDVTIQNSIIKLLKDIQEENEMSIIFVTHNLRVVSQIADRTAVMYGGQLLEAGPTNRVLSQPSNPYTKGLIGSIPRLSETNSTINPIRGDVPNYNEMPSGCPFADRCPEATEECQNDDPPVRIVSELDHHRVACVHAGSPPPADTNSEEMKVGIKSRDESSIKPVNKSQERKNE